MADPAREDEFYYLLTEGSELLQAGKIDDARKHLERALEMNPSHEQALNLLGLALFRLNHLERARTIFADLVHNNPIEPSLRLNLAMVHLKLGQVDDAKVELERVLELSPDHPRATSYMGLVLERKGDFERAAAAYEKAGNKKRADEIRAFRPTATGTFPMPNLRQMVSQPPTTVAPGPAAMAASSPPVAAASTPPSPVVAGGDSLAATPSIPRPPSQTGITAVAIPAPITAVTPLNAITSSADGVPEPTRASPQAEAAALTAAAAAHLKRAADPPAAAHVENARGASLGFTLEVEDGAASEPRPASVPGPTPSTPSSPPVSATSTTPATASTTTPTASPPPSPSPAADAGGGGSPRESGAVRAATPLPEERLADLVAQAALPEEPARRGSDGTVSFPIHDVGYVRTDLLVALAGAFELEPVHRRYRGKRTDSLFGGSEAALVALLGKGAAVLAPEKLSLRLLQLKNEEVYLVETSLAAFSQGLVWENGRLPSETDRDLDIVHLRGSGRMLLGTRAPLLVMPVRSDQPVTVHAARLVGWSGQLVPYRAPLPGLPDVARRVPVVRFEGTGVVLAL